MLRELGGNNAKDQSVVGQKILAFDRFLKSPQNTGADAVQAFLDNDGLSYDKTFARLSATTQQNVATEWALEGDGAVAKSVSGKLAFGSKNAYLDLFNKIPGVQGGSAAAGTDDLAALLGGDALDGVTDEAAGTAVFATLGLASDAIPIIGWIVNGIYLTTTVGLTLYNQHESSNQSKQAQYAFLRGAGIDDAHATAMANRGFFSNGSIAIGFANAYTDLGGNPDDFVSYINSLPVSSLDNMLSGLATTSGKDLPGFAHNDYFALPADPSVAAQRQYNPDTGTALCGGHRALQLSAATNMGDGNAVGAQPPGFVHTVGNCRRQQGYAVVGAGR